MTLRFVKCSGQPQSELALVPTSPQGGVISIPDSSPRTASTKRLKRVLSKERIITPDEETDIFLLKQVLLVPNLRRELINVLLALDSDAAVKARYCIAMEEFSGTKDEAERTAKGNKIVSMFIRNGSMFQCSGVPKDVQCETSWKTFDVLRLLRNQFELELVQLRETKAALHRLSASLRLVKSLN